jgi:hypothetical protein
VHQAVCQGADQRGIQIDGVVGYERQATYQS